MLGDWGETPWSALGRVLSPQIREREKKGYIIIIKKEKKPSKDTESTMAQSCGVSLCSLANGSRTLVPPFLSTDNFGSDYSSY